MTKHEIIESGRNARDGIFPSPRPFCFGTGTPPPGGKGEGPKKTARRNPRHGKQRAKESLRRPAGARGQRQNHPDRSDAVPLRGAAAGRAGGPRGRLSGPPRAGAQPGDHHLCQGGAADAAAHRPDAAGYPGPRGFFRRNGADADGAGLRRADHQRHGRRAEPHRNAVAAAGAVPDPDLSVHQQDGPAGRRPRRAAGRTTEKTASGLYAPRRRPGDAGAVQRGADGRLSGAGGAFRPGHGRGDCRTGAVPLLLWFGAASGWHRPPAGGVGYPDRTAILSRRIFGAGV